MAILFFEDAVTIYGDKAEKIEKLLRRKHGYKNKQFNDKLNELGSYEAYYKWLENELARIEQPEEDNNLDLESDIALIDKPIEKDIKHAQPDSKLPDEAVIDVLQYLQRVMSPDRVRAVAARFNIDSDIYQLAGLGSLPENYTDEDVWNTMDIGKQKPFYDHVWQPFYIKSLEKLQNLPNEIKLEIEKIIDSHQNKKEVQYPIDNETIGTAFEAKLLEDLIIEEKEEVTIISAGTFLKLLNY